MEWPLPAKNVLRQRNRSGKRNAALGTPSDNTTPRTLIRGLLNATSVSKSGISVPLTKRSKLTAPPSLLPPEKRRKSLRKSLGDDATPRTIIQHFLLEASPETPLEAHSPGVKEMQEEEDLSQQNSFNFVKDITTLPTDKTKNNEGQESQVTDHLFQSKNNSLEDHTRENIDDEDVPLGELEKSIHQDNMESIISEYDHLASQLNSDSSPQINNESPGISSMVDSSKVNHTAVVKSYDRQSKSKWKALVTPKVPIITRQVLGEIHELDSNISQTTSRSKEKVKRKTQSRTTVSQRKSVQSSTLPPSLIKSIFEHFSKRRIKNETLQVIEKGSSVFFKQLSSDLMAYCQHAGRSTIDLADMELLMKRQGLITTKQSFNSLIEKYLPLEYRQELIPVAQSGNKLFRKLN